MKADTPAAQIEYIPLFNLKRSPRNVRKVDAPIDDLIALIKQHGLLKNLVVMPAQDGNGFEVIAGDRRLRALQALEQQGNEAPLVPCLVLPEDASAEEISLAENVGHLPMHSADEFLAYQAVVDTEGLSAEDIAARFGKSLLYVEQRLKLASVSPKLLELFKKDKLRLAQVIALSITDNHSEQEKAWKAARAEWQQDPKELRKALTRQELSVEHDGVARYLGVADYEAGGGVARKDLFGSDDAAWLPDSKLARSLAKQKLDKALAALRGEGWSWYEARLEFNHDARRKFEAFGQSSYNYVDTTKKGNWDPEAKAVAGLLVTIDRQSGELVVHRGLVREADAKKARAASKAKTKTTKAGGAAKPAKKPGQLSFAQVQRLQGDRTAVLRKVLATDPRRALAALAADLARDQDLGSKRGKMLKYDTSGQPVVRVSGDRQFNVPGNIRDAIEKHPYTQELEKVEDEWAKRVKPGAGRMFAWLLEQPESLTHELLAFLVSRTIVAGEVFDKHKDRGIEFAATAGVDMTQHWSPTQAWLESQPKAVIYEAVAEACGKQAIVELDRLKQKPLVAARAAALLAGTGWVPKPLRSPVEKAARVVKSAGVVAKKAAKKETKKK